MRDGSAPLNYEFIVLTALAAVSWTRLLAWFWTLLRLLLMRPLTSLRTLLLFGFARETMIFLCMQNLEGEPIPAFIPVATDFAHMAARATDGMAACSVVEALFNVPTTAHCMGGALMAAWPAEVVCDVPNRLFGYRSLHICDGLVLGANLGVNPSLAIAALTEHAMSHIPQATQQTWFVEVRRL